MTSVSTCTVVIVRDADSDSSGCSATVWFQYTTVSAASIPKKVTR